MRKTCRTLEEGTLPPTIGDLAKLFDETKFFGYMDEELCTLLMDVSEFGLSGATGPPPRFYMKQLKQVQFVLFSPGNRGCISGGKDATWDDEARSGDGYGR